MVYIVYLVTLICINMHGYHTGSAHEVVPDYDASSVSPVATLAMLFARQYCDEEEDETRIAKEQGGRS